MVHDIIQGRYGEQSQTSLVDSLSQSLLLGNSGKPVTLEMLSLTKFLRMFFRNKKLTTFGSLEPVKPRIREYMKFGDRDLVKK
jgi:hypothetical protein